MEIYKTLPYFRKLDKTYSTLMDTIYYKGGWWLALRWKITPSKALRNEN